MTQSFNLNIHFGLLCFYLNGFNMFCHSCISIRLIHSKKDFIIIVLKFILKTQTLIFLCQMTHSWKVCFPKIYFITSFIPHCSIFFILFHWKYRYLHTFFVIISLFNHVNQMESLNTFFKVSVSEEKPDVVSVSVNIIFYN